MRVFESTTQTFFTQMRVLFSRWKRLKTELTAADFQYRENRRLSVFKVFISVKVRQISIIIGKGYPWRVAIALLETGDYLPKLSARR